MRITTLRLLILATVVTITACTTDFDLTAKWKDVTVVYGLLNATDTAQYIRISKAFLDDKNALQIAQVEDSVFYHTIDVKLDEYNDAGTATNSFPLTRVDGNLEGYPKEQGTFLSSPNWLYKTTAHLTSNRTYRLVVTKNDGDTLTAETKLVNNFSASKPFANQVINMLPDLNSFYTASWKNANNASFYGLTIRFNYTEYPVNQPQDSVTKYIDWLVISDYVPENEVAGANVEYKVAGKDLYLQLANQIPVNPSVRRISRSFVFTYGAGGTDLYTYYLVNKAKLGITSGQISPDYTNVQGGLGLLSSRLFVQATPDPNPVHKLTVDAIACNDLTRSLNFLNSDGLLCP